MPSASPEQKIKVLIVAADTLFRDLLRIALSQHPRLEVVGTFGDGSVTLEAVPYLEPQVAIVDSELSGSLNGIELSLALRRSLPKTGIVLLCGADAPKLIAGLSSEALAGCSYLFKATIADADALGRAIEGAAAGFAVLDPRLAASLREQPAELITRISPRQHEILALIAEGLSNRAIAKRLMLSEKSVENQINLLYQRLGIERANAAVHSRVTAALLYLQDNHPRSLGGRDA